MKINFYMCAVAVLGLALSGCDKGRKTLNVLKDQYKTVIEGPITAENVDQSLAVYVTLNMLASRYSDKSSGKQAAEEIEKLKSNLKQFVSEQTTKFNTCLDETAPSDKESTELANAIQKDVKRQSKGRGYNWKFPFKEGGCVAHEYGTEFSKKSSVEMIKIEKIEKVGQESVLAKVLFQVRSVKDVNADWQKKLEGAEAKEEHKGLGYNSAIPLDCKRAEELVEKFQIFAVKLGSCLDMGRKIGAANAVIGVKK